MKKVSSDPTGSTDRIRSWARSNAHGGSNRPDAQAGLPLSQATTTTLQAAEDGGPNGAHGASAAPDSHPSEKPATNTQDANKPAGAASQPAGTGTAVEASDAEKESKPKTPLMTEILVTTKKVLLHSPINILLIFVPVGIAVSQVPSMPPAAIFAINAVAIVPLAGLLSHATESVAVKLGDTLGALLNVSLGNSVELIIFIIALVKNEIRIVQSSLLGSILANLLLILGMSFFLGGLRFREQIYNSTVTQMSACLLSLSVISLVLPTAFHASFRNLDLADEQALKISRGTSVILLLVYLVYMLFQLKSHAYMYESTPQHIIDEESTPGPAAAWMESSSDSSSSDSDTDSSGSSRNTMTKRVKRAIRRRRRKSSVASSDSNDLAKSGTPSLSNNTSPLSDGLANGTSSRSPEGAWAPSFFPRMNTDASEEGIDEDAPKKHRKHRHKRHKRKHRKHRKEASLLEGDEVAVTSPSENIAGVAAGGNLDATPPDGEPRRVDFADTVTDMDGTADGAKRSGRPLQNLRTLSFKPVAHTLTPAVFNKEEATNANQSSGRVPRVRYGIRRTNSLPGRLNHEIRPPGAMLPSQVPLAAINNGGAAEAEANDDDLTTVAAVVLLIVSTALVATCAEFMVSAIEGLVESSPLGEVFIGLIILPIVGNAAEHVTAITVAMKNKMDLAIGVAVGSSIQIALFITPLVVILGWILNREMTLYFTLFETVCLFVSTFIVNFLVLDGRSNYLEGALLCATYVIIAVVAFFYPNGEDAAS